MKANDLSVVWPLWDLEELLFYPVKMSLDDSGLRLLLNPHGKTLFCQNTRGTPSRVRYSQQGPFWQATKPLTKAFLTIMDTLDFGCCCFHFYIYLVLLVGLKALGGLGSAMSQLSLQYRKPQQDVGDCRTYVCMAMG